ncbi:hypothetical protein V1281_004715 [Nitrobacteraceae bacterium AZCC 2161]
MTIPTTMVALIDHYAKEGNRPALFSIRASQVTQMIELEKTKHDPDKIDRSRSLEQFGNYYRANIAYIDQALEKLP